MGMPNKSKLVGDRHDPQLEAVLAAADCES
jgi:hypothetical protein